MRAEAIPIIRLEIDHMKHAIASALGIEGSDLEEFINEEIENQLAILVKDEIPRMVRDAIVQCTQDSLKSYFSYGDGAKAINDAISENFKID